MLERKQTERERAQQAQIVAELRNVIETAPDIIFKLDQLEGGVPPIHTVPSPH